MMSHDSVGPGWGSRAKKHKHRRQDSGQKTGQQTEHLCHRKFTQQTQDSDQATAISKQLDARSDAMAIFYATDVRTIGAGNHNLNYVERKAILARVIRRKLSICQALVTRTDPPTQPATLPTFQRVTM